MSPAPNNPPPPASASCRPAESPAARPNATSTASRRTTAPRSPCSAEFPVQPKRRSSVKHPPEKQPVRWRRFQQRRPLLRFHQLAQLLDRQSPLAHLHERANNRPHHLIKKPVCSNCDRDHIAFLDNRQLRNRPHVGLHRPHRIRRQRREI